MKRLLILLLLTTWLAIPVRAEKWALLVGINNYPNDISPLRYCVADVVAFRGALVNVAGFKRDKIFLMTDKMEGQMEPTNINVVKRLGILAKQVQPQDTFVFYFSGHGIVNDGSSFLLAVNSDTATQDTLEMSAVPLDRVSKILSSVKAQQLLTVIDACRNNSETGRSGEDNVLTDDFSKGFKIRRSSSNRGQPSVSATLYACNVGERAYEWADKGHGVFSYYLLDGLNGEAVNSQGEVTVTGLAEYTQSQVVKWAEEFRGKKQTPWLSLQGGAKLVLAKGVDKVEATAPLKTISSIDAEAEMWAMVKDSDDPNDIEEFLALFPGGKLVAVAKFKLKKLQPKVGKPISPVKRTQIKPNKHDISEVTGSKDRSGMVLIPAGPSTPVFYMDKYEVTNAQYGKFMRATAHRKPKDWNNTKYNQPNQPVVGVSWHDATAYAKWAGKRLPSEAEWEYAARGGLKGKEYPWGDQEPSSSRANYSGNVGKPTPVGSYPANGYGLYDMAGNVWEWCQDWYSSDREYRVLRGGSWTRGTNSLRVASRTDCLPTDRNFTYGFRCVSGSK